MEFKRIVANANHTPATGAAATDQFIEQVAQCCALLEKKCEEQSLSDRANVVEKLSIAARNESHRASFAAAPSFPVLLALLVNELREEPASEGALNVQSQCLRVIGNMCVNNDARRLQLCTEFEFARVLVQCLRRHSKFEAGTKTNAASQRVNDNVNVMAISAGARAEFLKFACGVLANLCCDNAAVQLALLQSGAPAALAGALALGRELVHVALCSLGVQAVRNLAECDLAQEHFQSPDLLEQLVRAIVPCGIFAQNEHSRQQIEQILPLFRFETEPMRAAARDCGAVRLVSSWLHANSFERSSLAISMLTSLAPSQPELVLKELFTLWPRSNSSSLPIARLAIRACLKLAARADCDALEKAFLSAPIFPAILSLCQSESVASPPASAGAVSAAVGSWMELARYNALVVLANLAHSDRACERMWLGDRGRAAVESKVQGKPAARDEGASQPEPQPQLSARVPEAEAIAEEAAVMPAALRRVLTTALAAPLVALAADAGDVFEGSTEQKVPRSVGGSEVSPAQHQTQQQPSHPKEQHQPEQQQCKLALDVLAYLSLSPAVKIEMGQQQAIVDGVLAILHTHSQLGVQLIMGALVVLRHLVTPSTSSTLGVQCVAALHRNARTIVGAPSDTVTGTGTCNCTGAGSSQAVAASSSSSSCSSCSASSFPSSQTVQRPSAPIPAATQRLIQSIRAVAASNEQRFRWEIARLLLRLFQFDDCFEALSADESQPEAALELLLPCLHDLCADPCAGAHDTIRDEIVRALDAACATRSKLWISVQLFPHCGVILSCFARLAPGLARRAASSTARTEAPVTDACACTSVTAQAQARAVFSSAPPLSPRAAFAILMRTLRVLLTAADINNDKAVAAQKPAGTQELNLACAARALLDALRCSQKAEKDSLESKAAERLVQVTNKPQPTSTMMTNQPQSEGQQALTLPLPASHGESEASGPSRTQLIAELRKALDTLGT